MLQTGSNAIQSIFGNYWTLLQDYVRSYDQIGCSSNKTQYELQLSVEHHEPNLNNHPLFEEYIGAIDGMHVKVGLPREERDNFICRKGIRAQNVLIACNFNSCFTFVLASMVGTMHDSHILAHAIQVRKLIFHIMPRENIIFLT